MKTLYLLRHAMALPAGTKADKERKLAPKGEMDAGALGRAMAAKKYQPAYVICSPATRTQQTLNGLMESVGKTETDFPRILYEGGAGDIFALIQKIEAPTASVLVVAHNPAIHELAAKLTGGGSPSLLSRLASEGFRPCTLAVLSCPVTSWADLNLGENDLIDYMEPVDYNAPSTPARWT